MGEFMKKKVTFFVLAIVAALLLFVIKLNGGTKTIEEVINKDNSDKVSILHEEKHGKASIVFGYVSDGNGLYTAIARKGITGYKIAYSGVQGDIELVSEKFGMSYTYFPSIEKVGLPIYFGVIGNPDISEIRIVEKKSGAQKQAKIIETNGTRLWLVYMNSFKGSEFDITGYSSDDKELVKIDGNIAPLYVEQKPYKGYD
ncbi:MAG: hypothetical protein K0S41_1734 [Anaerocolumna sp.]|jgi:hypothetical protein|nr:hypothetical protein [Anaerocolumna sp.]